MKVSLIIPCYNEEEVISSSFERIKKMTDANTTLSDQPVEWELFFINDGSKDKTYSILKDIASKDHDVRVINFSRNFGHQPAVTAGIHHCKGDAAVILDSDMQDPPEVIPAMIELWQEKGCHGVYAVREKRKGETAFKKITASLFYKTINNLSDIDLPRNTGDFRLIDRKIIDQFSRLKEGGKYIRGLIPWLGFTQEPFYYTREARTAGETKYPLHKMIKLAANGILSLSSKPLEKIVSLGVFSLVVAFLMVVYTIISFIHPSIWIEPGWASLMIVILFFSGIILISLGIIGLYIGKIFNEIKDRPEYVIDEILNDSRQGEV